MRAWIAICLLLLFSTAYADAQPRDSIPANWPWRGVNLGFHDGATTADLKRFHNRLRINAVRLQITARKYAMRTGVSGEQAFLQGLEWADAMLDVCEKLGVSVLLDVSDFPMDPLRPDQTSPAFWKNRRAKDGVVNLVQKLVEHFKNRGNELAAYGIMSEPVIRERKKSRVPPGWPDLLSRIVKSIREVDAQRWIVVSPGPWGGPNGYRTFVPPGDRKLIWGVHMYVPHGFTHQGIRGRDRNVRYPGMIRGTLWEKDRLRSALAPLRRFQKKHPGPVLVGEFSAVRWAKGGEQYIKDLVSIFNEYGWGWAYFSATGWQGWNPDYNSVYGKGEEARKQLIGEKSERWQTLRSIFGIQQGKRP